jgi:hypothetical protein
MPRWSPLFLTVVLASGCGPGAYQPIDVAERLPPGEARAGVITDEAALFGGISAEGRVGDVKIYNDRVQFVIQGVRPGSYYIAQGGSVIDADLVRPEGQLNHDAVDEWQGMYGLGRLTEADSVSVVASGALGGPAIVHVEGHESALALLEGVFESNDIVEDLHLRFATDFILPPDSDVLEVRTTITATDLPAEIQPGDLLLGGLEVLDPWDPGVGLEAPADTRAWSALIGKKNEVAYAVAIPSGELQESSMDMLGSLIQTATAFGDDVSLAPGESVVWERLYAVGRDPAAISDALLERQGAAFDEVTGTVTAPDGPVAGARVNVSIDDKPYTLAFTKDDGTFSARVPAGSSPTLLAVGRATGRFPDFATGATSYPAYGAATVRQATLDAFVADHAGPSAAEGRGVASPTDPLVLGEPATIVVRSGDGLPFEVRVAFADGDAEVDDRLVPGRPNGYAAEAWARDGEVRFVVEPGSYELVAHRGIRYELDQVAITAVAGQEQIVDVALPEAYVADGFLLGDTHMHASPSSDTNVSMEDRVIGAAAVGLQLHFGTDHDHVADYRPIVTALGLDPVLRSVVADEVSPVLRGHMNIYPIEPVLDQPNNGAWAWWSEFVDTTAAEFAMLRDRHGPDFILQSNHPLDSGLGQAAGWRPGEITKPDFWSDGFDAIEAENAGDFSEYLPFFVDLFLRGHPICPLGSSDSHGHIGDQGASATFLGMGSANVADYSNAALTESIRARRTIVTRGVFLDLSIAPGAEVTGTQTLTVQAKSPTWIKVDRLVLFRDGAPIETVTGTTATFTLDPEKDAAYWVIAEGDTPMQPIWSFTPWAMSSPIRLDTAGDGWEPPLPPLLVE